MLSIRRTLIGAALAVGMLAQAQQAVALTFDLDTTFSGTPPDNTYSATFSSSCGADCVRLTMSIAGLTVADFNFSSLCGQGCGEGSFFSAAHMQGIGPSDDSGWIGDGDGGGNGVPEPGSLLLLGSAALAAVGLSLSKRNLG